MERARTAMAIARWKRPARTDDALIPVKDFADPTHFVESSTTGQLVLVRPVLTRTRHQTADVSASPRVAGQTAIVRLEVLVWAASAKLFAGTDWIAPRVKDACPACASCLASVTASVPTARLA